jgi:hypothetical protein
MGRVYRNVDVIDRETGAKLNEERDRVTVDGDSKSKKVTNGLFSKVWVTGGLDKLGNMEIAFLIRIMKYVDHRDNTIRNDGEAMTVKEMSEVTGIGYARLSEAVKGMVEMKVMGKHSTGIVDYIGRRSVIYSVNPCVICKGTMIDKRICSYYGID